MTTSPDPSPEAPQRKITVSRVGVLGTPLAYQRDCVWPQPDIQLRAAENELEVWNLTELIRVADAAPSLTSDARESLGRMRAELRACEKKRDLLRQEVETKGGGLAPIMATVGDIFTVQGSGDEGMPATVEVVGRAFGEWKTAKQAPMARFPVSMALFEEAWPMEDLVPHIQSITTPDEDDEDDDDDGALEDGEGGDAGDAAPSEQQQIESAIAQALLGLVERQEMQMGSHESGPLVVIPAAKMEGIFNDLTALRRLRGDAPPPGTGEGETATGEGDAGDGQESGGEG